MAAEMQAEAGREPGNDYARARQQARMLEALLRTTQELNSTLDLRRVLEIIVQQVCSLIAVDSCVITLLNPDTGTLTPVIALHDWADQVLGLTLRLGEGVTGRVAETGAGLIVNRADLDPRAVAVPGTPDEPESLLAAPLQCEGRVIGVMTLCRLGESEFSAPDLDLLNSFAAQAAVAVRNARLYTESEGRARELERAHSRLQKAQNQLLQAEKLSAIGHLAAGMAHELNNPLTAIIGFAQLLEEAELDATSRGDVQRILEAAGRAKSIVANLLAYSRQQRMTPQRVDLSALLERILGLHEAEFQGSGLTVRHEIEQDLPEASVDPAQVEQLLLHLMRNRCRALAQAGGTLTVRLARQGEGLVRLEVADDGPSIPPDLRPHLFDPYFTTDEVGDWLGLGLPAAFGIVRAHGGRIWAETPGGVGSRLVVELPLEAPTGGAPVEEIDGRPILIVAEDGATAQALLAAVEAMGHRPTRVTSGEAAVAEIVVRHYDLILCDQALPGMGIRRVYLSAQANDPQLAERFVAVGAPGPEMEGMAWVGKPVEAEQVQACVAASLRTG